MQDQRAFRGVWIPSEIYLDPRLTPTEVCLLAEIDSLDLGEGCDADNRYFAEFCRCDVRSISRYISHLRLIGQINVTNIGGVRRIYRRTDAVAEPKKIPERKRFIPPTVEEVRAYCEERKNGINAEQFIDYYSTRGWLLTKGVKMTDWRACVRTWERMPERKRKENEKEDGYLKHEYTKEQLDAVVKRMSECGDMPWDIDEIAEYAAQEGIDVDAQEVWDYFYPTNWKGVEDWRQAVKDYYRRKL